MNESESAIIVKKRGISRIWIVPVIAVLIGSWMIFEYLDKRGVVINISMANAEGVTPGKTLIKTRSVPIGMVTEVRLAETLQHVIVAAEIEKPYLNLLKSDSLIWAVQPRIDESGISGLNTILSGIYFELQPGTTDSVSYQFELLDAPPLVAQYVAGRRYHLYSSNAEVLDVGAPVIFKGVKVGSIEKANFDWFSESMYYQIFIEQPNYNLVTVNTLFWVESGIEFDLSADGINIKTGSLAKLFRGGITFGIPEREPKGVIAEAEQRFILSSSFKESLDERYDDFEYYVVTLDQSVRGLKPGAPVEYRGVRVGTVVEVPALLEQDGKPHFITDNSKQISVLIKIEFERIYRDTNLARSFWMSNIDQWIKEGLKLSLQTGNLLTGALFLEFDFYQDETTDRIETIATYKVIPGTSSGFSQLTAQMSDFLGKLNSLKIEQTLSNLDSTLSSISQLTEKIEILVQQTSAQNIPDEINTSLSTLQATLKDFQNGAPIYTDVRQTLKAIEQLGRDFQNGAPVYADIRQSLKAIEQLSKELQPLSRSLNEHPNILIFDKSPDPDVQPQRGFDNE